jgi:D-glycero-D-manno-heptose 1,7-bisphosphate phosphatase
MQNKAIFADRDGVIFHNDRSMAEGPYYITSYNQAMFIKGALEAIKMLYEAGYKIYVVSMQNSITEGIVSAEVVDNIFKRMAKDVMRIVQVPVKYKACTTPVEDEVLKIWAKCHAVMEFAEEDGINLSQSVGIGDAKSDIVAFRNAGCGTNIHISIPRGDRDVEEADWVADSLYEAAFKLIYDLKQDGKI